MSFTDGWSAWRDKMPGKNPKEVHVGAEFELGSDGYMLTIAGAPEIWDDPETIMLRLIVVEPTTASDVMTTYPVSWSSEAEDAAKRVIVQTPDGDVTIEPIRDVQ
jgi:hypothetical protein